MTTPDFKDWLGRQEIPIEDTTTVDKYDAYLERELGIHGGSLDVAHEFYEERYEILPTLGIRPFERHYLFRGVPSVETRYAIKGYPGAWGKTRMYEIAAEIADDMGLEDIAVIMLARAEE